jgi:hypothetical protein
MDGSAYYQVPRHTILALSHEEIQNLADRLFSRGMSSLSTYSPTDRVDLIAASRALRRLLVAFERASGQPLHTILLTGGC